MKPINAFEQHQCPLLSQDDLRERVLTLVGPAIRDRQLWIMFLDADRCQLPVLPQIDDMPIDPEPEPIEHLLHHFAQILADQAPGGSVVFALERWGPHQQTDSDLAWGATLRERSAAVGLEVAGVFLASSSGVRPMRRAGRLS